MENIEKLIGKPALLEQLAEEASELAQAALKLSRILRGENPTPVTEEDAMTNLKEEFTDVVQCADQLLLEIDVTQLELKEKRWYDRIEEANKNGKENNNN
jgi:NTP pyrophosphatase (non-canonical NTP hydrolase)